MIIGWVSNVTLQEKVYLNLIKEFSKNMNYIPGMGITCFLGEKRIKITRSFIHTLLELANCKKSIFSYDYPSYSPTEACSRVIGKPFKIP